MKKKITFLIHQNFEKLIINIFEINKLNKKLKFFDFSVCHMTKNPLNFRKKYVLLDVSPTGHK